MKTTKYKKEIEELRVRRDKLIKEIERYNNDIGNLRNLVMIENIINTYELPRSIEEIW